MGKLLLSILALFFTVTTFPAFAEVVTNDHRVPFSVETDLDMSCFEPEVWKLTNPNLNVKMRVMLLCDSIEHDNQSGSWIWWLAPYGNRTDTLKLIEVMLGHLATGEETYSYEVVKKDLFKQYGGLLVKEIEFSSGGKARFPYTEMPIGSGQLAEVYYITLYINNRVYRHHALVRVAKDSESLPLWILFMNTRFTSYKDGWKVVTQGQNDKVIDVIPGVLSGLSLE